MSNEPLAYQIDVTESRHIMRGIERRYMLTKVYRFLKSITVMSMVMFFCVGCLTLMTFGAYYLLTLYLAP